jgi:hypothetical protein
MLLYIINLFLQTRDQGFIAVFLPLAFKITLPFPFPVSQDIFNARGSLRILQFV